MALDVTEYMQSYINQFDYLSIFKLNFLECIQDRQAPEFLSRKKLLIRAIDKTVIDKISRALKSPNDPYSAILTIIEEYRTAPQTQFSKELLEEFINHQSTYLRGKAYHQLQLDNAQRAENMTVLAKSATDHFKKQEFLQACVCFGNNLKLAELCLEADTNLATCYYNYGRALQRAGVIDKAIPMLTIAQKLRESFKAVDAEAVKKCTTALEECQSLLHHDPNAEETTLKY